MKLIVPQLRWRFWEIFYLFCDTNYCWSCAGPAWRAMLFKFHECSSFVISERDNLTADFLFVSLVMFATLLVEQSSRELACLVLPSLMVVLSTLIRISLTHTHPRLTYFVTSYRFARERIWGSSVFCFLRETTFNDNG